MSCITRLIRYSVKKNWFPKLYGGKEYTIELTYFSNKIYTSYIKEFVIVKDKKEVYKELLEFSYGKCLQCGNVKNCQIKTDLTSLLYEFKPDIEYSSNLNMEKELNSLTYTDFMLVKDANYNKFLELLELKKTNNLKGTLGKFLKK